LTGMPCDGHFVRHKAVARSRNLLLDSPSYEPKGYRQNVGGGGSDLCRGGQFRNFLQQESPASWMEAASDEWGRKTNTGELPAWAKRAQKPTFSRQRSPTAGFSRANSGSGDAGMVAQLHLNAHERALAMLLLSRTSTVYALPRVCSCGWISCSFALSLCGGMHSLFSKAFRS
jgi:hypothetical protein